MKSPTKNPNTENEKVNQETQSSEVFDLEDTEEPRSKKRKLTNKNHDSNSEISSETKKIIPCPYCKVNFTRDTMKEHIQTFHENKIQKPNLQDSEESVDKSSCFINDSTVSEKTALKKPEYECHICKKNFGNNDLDFENHLKKRSHKYEMKQQQKIEKENLQFELKLKAKAENENEKVNQEISEKSIKARDLEKIQKKFKNKKRKIVKNNIDSEDEHFNNEDYFIETQPSEMIKNDGCKSCDKKPKSIEQLIKQIDTGTGYIIPDEKKIATFNRIELCLILNEIRTSYHDNQLWMYRNYTQMENYSLYKYKCQSCTGTFQLSEELTVHVVSVHENNQLKQIEPLDTIPDNNHGSESSSEQQDQLDQAEIIEPILAKDNKEIVNGGFRILNCFLPFS